MTYPSSPGFKSAEIIDREQGHFNEAGNLRIQARSLNAQRWEIMAEHPEMNRGQAAEIMAFIKSQRGRAGIFEVTLPIYSNARGTVSGSVLTNGAASAGANSLSIDGITGTLLKGDFIKFNGHTKVYMVTEDRDGSGSLTFYPSLRSSVADNEAITYDSVPFTVRLNDNVQSYSVSTAGLTTKSVGFIEVV